MNIGEFNAQLEAVRDWPNLTYRTLHETMIELFKLRKCEKLPRFELKTGYGRKMYSRLKKEGENFGMNTMISICISLDVGYAATVKILELAGYTFRHGNSLHDIYITLVMYHGGNRAEQFNDLLKSYGYTKKTERLGPQK